MPKNMKYVEFYRTLNFKINYIQKVVIFIDSLILLVLDFQRATCLEFCYAYIKVRKAKSRVSYIV